MTKDLAGFANFILRFLRDGIDVLRNPLSDPQKALLVIGILSAILLIFFLISTLVYLLIDARRRETPQPRRPLTPQTRRDRWT